MSVEVYLAYLIACALTAIIPGPTVTLIVANSLTHGTRAGQLNVAGTQLALALMIGVLVVGLASVIQTMGWCSTGCASQVRPIWCGSAGSS